MLEFIQKHKKLTAFCSVLCVTVLTSLVFSRPLTYLALNIYDTYITPYNGECAYRLLNNDCSCSEYFRNIVDKEGVLPAIAAMPKQFHRCNMALQELKRRAESGQKTLPACCVASACCAGAMMAPIPIPDDSSSDNKSPDNNYVSK